MINQDEREAGSVLKRGNRLVTLIVVGALAISGAMLLRSYVSAGYQPTPEFEGTQLNGETWRLVDHRGKGPLIVTFAATWCMPCRIELPELQRLYETYHERGLEIVVVGNEDQPTLRADPLFGATPVPVIHGGGKVHLDYQVDALPRTLVFAADGTLAGVYDGVSARGLDEIERFVRAMIEGAPAP